MFGDYKKRREEIERSQGFYPENKGKKLSIYDCFYCGLRHLKVECGGMFYCPNPLCSGPGGYSWRRDLDSFTEVENGRHTVDTDEWQEKALQWADESGDSYIMQAVRGTKRLQDKGQL